MSSISAGASLATVLACLWIADRVLSPILELEQCRRGIRASLVVASTLSNNISRLAGRGDVDALNALSETRKDLARKADRLSTLQTRSSIPLRLYIGIRGYDLAEAARALMRLGRLVEGLPLLDEAMLAVTSDRLSPLVTGLIYCGAIAACQQSYALDRAREWTAALHGWCEAQPLSLIHI